MFHDVSLFQMFQVSSESFHSWMNWNSHGPCGADCKFFNWRIWLWYRRLNGWKEQVLSQNMKGPWGYWEHTLSWQPARPCFSERCRAELVCHTNILYLQPYLQRLVQCITKYTLQHSMQSAQHLLTVVEADCWLVQHRPRQPVSI